MQCRVRLLPLVICLGTMLSSSRCAQMSNIRRRERLSAPDAARFNAELFGDAHSRPLLTRGKILAIRKVEVPSENYNDHFEDQSHSIAHQYLIRVEEEEKSIVHAKLVQMASFVQYLAYDTFQIVITKSEITKVLEINGVTAAYDFPTTLKMHEELISSHQGSGSETVRSINLDFERITLNVLIAWNFEGDSLNELCKGEEDSFCNVREVTPGKKVAIDTAKKSLFAVLQNCAAHPLVIWVEERKEMKLLNKYASKIIQGQGKQNLNSSQHPFWESGLTGKGEIIGEERTCTLCLVERE